MELEIRNLGNTSDNEVTSAFLSAFSDYGMALDAEALRAMFKRRGARFDLSSGAFADGRLVSFIINGIGVYNGVATAYDTGTGTLPGYRGLGLTDKIFERCSAELAAAGVRRYLLEVLTHNTAAVKIYTRQGFEISRRYDCFRACCAEARECLREEAAPGVSVGSCSVGDIRRMNGFVDFTPSWQNSFDSIARNADAFTCIVARMEGEPVGFGVSEPAYGDISLLAVSPAYRRRGIGSALLRRLLDASRIADAKVLNVQAGPDTEHIRRFLESSGFGLSCSQFEMTRSL